LFKERLAGVKFTVGRIITRLRAGDTELQDRIWAEAHRLYETKAPLIGAVDRLIEIAGDNPNAFRGFTSKHTKGLNKTPKGRAVMGLVGMASTERDAALRTGVRLTLGRHSSKEKALAAMPVTDAFDLLANEEPRLLDAEAAARQLAVDHREDDDGGMALRESLSELSTRVVFLDRLVGKKSEKIDSVLATGAAAMVVYEHLAVSAGVDTRHYRTAAVSWWPRGD